MAGCAALLASECAFSQSLPAVVQVVPSCRFEASSAVLDFGSIDATRTAPATAAVQLGYRCIRGVMPVVNLGNGMNRDSSSGLRQLASGTNRIPYSLAVTGAPAPGAGLKATLSLTLTGSISVPAMQAASAGSYTDTVVLNISP
ncbi:MAG TPA: spore coat protein U domain-containing protein [Burkholderiales bacterium]